VAAREELRRLAGAVADPEIPVLTIDDLGILRDLRVDGAGRVEVDLTPTYSGCPALEVMRQDVEQRIRDSGHPQVTVNVVLAPAWTTDWMSDEGRRKLREHGVAPPRPRTATAQPRPRTATAQPLPMAVACPVCGSAHTTEVAHFASTPCQALRRCSDCSEPFQHFKEH
jgi:ring-1,2-phenylacetyl-CoA epoxidase subunit PaaD